MQFKHPELLWALFLLLIPIFIHLFQLRRFKKTPFTNVKLLQKVVSESRRSNRLKKWLLLCSRLLLLAALVMAFAQPFLAKTSALKQKELVIYLDDSFSMQARTERGNLLEVAIQDLFKSIPAEAPFSLFTNERTFRNQTLKEVQNDLLSLKHTQNQLDLNEIYLKARTLFSNDDSSIKDLVIISDFQDRMAKDFDSLPSYRNHFIRMQAERDQNIVIDSAYLKENSPNNTELTVLLKGFGEVENTPVSLYNQDKLIAKTAAIFDGTSETSVVFTLPDREAIEGTLEISDNGLIYDNRLYFNLGEEEKIKVLSINNSDDSFLRRIYTEDEFEFNSYAPNALNYALIETQNLIILNELTDLPLGLQNALRSFVEGGGSLLIVPPVENSAINYNSFTSNFHRTRYLEKVNSSQNITTISFNHPLYRNVFEKEINNFQYPRVSSYYKIRTTAPSLLSLQGGDPFLVGIDRVYVFAAALNSSNSNFKNSPLIVPTLYSIGTNSLKRPPLYFQTGSNNEIDMGLAIGQDDILTLSKPGIEFIPRQQSFANKTTLEFKENPVEDGIYAVGQGNSVFKKLSFNYPRAESIPSFGALDNINSQRGEENIREIFERLEKDNEVTALWKWFVIFALLFACAEILIQKYLK